MPWTLFALIVLIDGPALAKAQAPPASMQWDFETATVGELPQGWSEAQTGEGEASEWSVLEDSTAPQGPKVLAQTFESPRPVFNLCIVDESEFKDGRIQVSFMAVKGEIDQGGGLVWRYVDEGNYYVARFNPLESNLRLYKVVDGQRMQLATREELAAAEGEWHTLAVATQADRIECSLNGTKYLEARDDTFAESGKVGLWTKADAQTWFDDLQIEAE